MQGTALKKTIHAKLNLMLVVALLSSCGAESDSSSLSSHSRQAMPAIVDYEQARKVFWDELYVEGGKSLYCAADFSSRHRQGFNVEHVFPMSWVTRAMSCGTRKQCRSRSAQFNRIESDLHNLYPSLTVVNAARSSYRFAEIRGEAREFGESCDFEVDRKRRLAEPADEVAGDIARAMFYMAYQYQGVGLQIFAKTGRLLQQWHNSDPPDDQEISRNTRIEKLQGNRNPFIDDPELLNTLIRQNTFY